MKTNIFINIMNCSYMKNDSFYFHVIDNGLHNRCDLLMKSSKNFFFDMETDN